MLHFSRRVALGVNVADLFEFECTLESRREIVVTPKVQKVITVLVLPGNFETCVVGLQSLLYEVRNALDRCNHFATLVVTQMAKSTEVEREQSQSQTLRGISFR